MREVSSSLMSKMDGLKTLFNEMREKLKETSNELDDPRLNRQQKQKSLIINHVQIPPQPATLGLL